MNNVNIDKFCKKNLTVLRRMWNVPNTTHDSDLLHLMSDDLPIFDELCRRSLTFITKCIFHSNNLIRFVARRGIIIDYVVNHMVKKHCFNTVSYTHLTLPTIYSV